MASTQPHPGETRSRHAGRGHIAALDGVRGLAVLGVMATHLLAGNTARLGVVGNLLALGVNGVDIFFVLSGFLITGILHDSLGDSFYFRKFYARRVLRIFPLYYGVILVLMMMTGPLHLHWNGLQWSLLLYLQNTHFLFPSLRDFHTPYFDIDHLWSLAVEEQFYLVWPLLVALMPRPRRLLAVCVAGIVLSFGLRLWALQHGWGFDWANRNALCRADEMLGGAALALLLRTGLAERTVRLAVPVFFASLLLKVSLTYDGILLGRPGWYVPVATTVNYTLMVFLGASLLAWCLQPESRVREAFEWKPLRAVGKYSYGLYILHLVLLPGITLLLLQPLRSVFHGVVMARLAVGIAVFAISFLAAYLSFHLYEKQFLRLKRFFDYDTRPAPAL